MFVRIMVFWFASIGAALLAQAGDPLFFTAEDGHKQFGTGYVYDAAYSPTADEIAVLTNRGLFVLSAETHELLRHRLLSEDFRFLKYSPDGTLIVLVGSLIQNDADVALRKTKYPIVNATRMGIVDVDSLSFVKKVNQSVRLPFYGDSYADFVGVWFSNLSKSNLYNLLKHPNYLNFSSDSRYFAAQSDNNV
ncbi:MAG: hypothetical protein GC154_03600, partial [bacterium]|nr:hypothetical protein [bacterium]